MSIEEEYVAHPRLYGAPAYARPASAVEPTPLPLDPDDLPIAAVQTPQEQRLAEVLLARPYQSVRPVRALRAEPGPEPQPRRAESGLEPQALRLRTVAGRILHRAS